MRLLHRSLVDLAALVHERALRGDANRTVGEEARKKGPQSTPHRVARRRGVAPRA